MTALEAMRRHFVPVRINLDEGDVERDTLFFRKLFHSVAQAAFSAGAYGGRKSEAYFSYLDLISGQDVVDKEHIPFIFPFIIERAMRAGSQNIHIPDDILSEDLSSIANKLGKPLVLLFYECNVLRSDRIILEKMRNIFMNMSGYMLVFAATGEFFPMMDEIFSPIMRQFKRIDIGPFKTINDVEDCIRHPLRNLGLRRADIRRLSSQAFVKDVDMLSGRRPYEIKLICHTLFRRCQEGISKRFALDLKTLENIQTEVAPGQNIQERHVIRYAKI